jgi:hypothetical protein
MTKPMKFEIRDALWAQEIQNGLDQYMMGLYESVDAEEGTPEAEKANETESGLPFCACGTCETREILSFVAPRIIKGYLDKKIGFVEVGDDWDGKTIEVSSTLKHD